LRVVVIGCEAEDSETVLMEQFGLPPAEGQPRGSDQKE
jgi:hypothetical protein